MVQIFVKVNGSKATPMEVNLTDDKVEDVMRQIQKDEDVYVTMHGRVLKRSEKLKSCEVTDGCTIQVTSRVRGGGRHKDKRSKAEKNQAASTRTPEQKFAEEAKSVKGPATQECDRDTAVRMIEENEETRKVMIQMMEENEDNRKMIESMSEGSDVDMEHTLQNYRTAGRDVLGWDQEQVEMMERGLRWAIEARRKGRCEDKRQQEQEEQRRQARQEQSKQVRFGDEEQFEETRTESTDEQKVTGELAEVRTGRGGAGLVPGGDERCQADEICRKGKGKGNGGKGDHGNKGDNGGKGFQQSVKVLKGGEEEDERGRVAPNMGAGGSHPQATSDPRKEKEKKETRVLSWADCNDEEGKEHEEEVEEEKEAGQRETTEERPPGLEEVDSKQEAKKEQEAERKQKQEQEQERRAQEAREEERRAQEAREERRAQETREELKRTQEAREEERKAQEAHEEQRRAQKALEKRKAQEEQEREAKAQEERKKEVRVQEEREREVSAHEEQREQEREAEAQEGHEGEVKAQEEQGEDANSLHEESHVSNRHMTWWHNAWWVRVNNGPHLRTARDRRRVWRAATRAAQEVRETGYGAGGEREKREQGKTDRTESNTLHVVFHFPTPANTTAAAAMRQHQ